MKSTRNHLETFAIVSALLAGPVPALPPDGLRPSLPRPAELPGIGSRIVLKRDRPAPSAFAGTIH